MTRVFAHRGSAQLTRENTIAAFVAARKLGADGVELDVRRTADGHPVVHHDAGLAGIGLIAGLFSSELPGWIPSLGEALDACRPLEVNVEIKQAEGESEAGEDPFAFEVARLLAGRREASQIVVSSFSLSVIDAVLACVPSMATALLVRVAEDPFRALMTAHDHGHRGLHPFYLTVDEALFRAATAASIKIRAWTVDDPARIAELGEMGVDAVITKDVAAARLALGRTDG